MFGWGTSGYDHGAVNWQLWSGNQENQWHTMSRDEWVFLPMAGARTIDGVYEDLPTYHTSTVASDCAYIVQHCCVDAGAHRGDGFAVRLVREVE